MKFKVGDCVKYVSNGWGDERANPLWGGEYGKVSGKVYFVSNSSSGLPIGVVWNNGKKNSYKTGDLELLSSNVWKGKSTTEGR